ncbi:MAG: response regulator, partial [Limisphaerales bacterium]
RCRVGSWRSEELAFTLTEMMVSAAILILLVGGSVLANLFGMRMLRKHPPFPRLQLPESWRRSIATSAFGLLGVCCCGLASADPRPPVPVAETYTSAYEKAPHPNFVDRENTARWAQTEQDKYRLRVVLPETLSPEEEGSSEVQAESSQRSHAGRARPPGGQPEESQTLAYVALLIFAAVLCISRLRPDLLETYFHPWHLMPATLRRRLQQACAPQDTSPAEGRRLFRAMQQGAGPGFLEPEPQQLDVLGGIMKTLQEARDPLKRQEVLLRAYLLTHALTPISEPRCQRAAWQIRHSLEALLKRLMAQSVQPTATALFTAAKAVEVLQELRAAGPQGEAVFEWPIRILAVYDDPVTDRAMEGVLQSVFENPQFATDGESAMAIAGERAFDVIFIDVALQGIDGYVVCGMLRQIAMHHYTPVVLVTDRVDASARADADARGADDLISKPLWAAEVTLKALIFALRYRLAGGGATPRNAAQACASRLVAQGQVPEDCGIVCGTHDTEILRVVTRN